MRSSSGIEAANNAYVHVIAYASCNDGNGRASVGVVMGNVDQNGSLETLSPTFKKPFCSFRNIQGSTQTAIVKLNSRSRTESFATTVYWDDVVIYTDDHDSLDTSAPIQPGSVTISGATANSLSVSWGASPGDSGSTQSGVAGYLVVRGTSDPTTAPNTNATHTTTYSSTLGSGTVVYNGPDTSFTDNGLSPSTTYYYRIYTYDRALNYSTAATGNGATTPAGGNTPPTAPPDKTLGTIKNTAAHYAHPKLLAGATDADGDTLSVTAAGPSSAQGGTAVWSSTEVTYTPLVDYTGPDSFTYTISDGHGGTAVGTVNVTVDSGTGASPNVVAGPTYANGRFSVTFAGIPGFTYTVQYAETAPAPPWTKLANLTAETNGLFVVEDTVSQSPSRYYRTVYPSY